MLSLFSFHKQKGSITIVSNKVEALSQVGTCSSMAYAYMAQKGVTWSNILVFEVIFYLSHSLSQRDNMFE